MDKEEYKRRFKERMTSFTKTFDDGSSVEQYADEVWLSYYEAINDGEYEPEIDADADISYWGE